MNMRNKARLKGNNAEIYRFWRNKVTSLIRIAKSNYFNQAIKSNTGNTKAIWQIVRNVQSNDSGMQSDSSPNVLIMHENEMSDPVDIANAFNSSFTSVSSTYVHDFGPMYNHDFNDVQQVVSSILPNYAIFHIPEVSEEYVFKSLKNLDSSKATGLDGISAHFLKLCAHEITGSITHILNISIKNDVYPSSWKHAKVIPIYKNESKLDVSNYRPISILPVLSKLLERHVHCALYGYLKTYDLLRIAQSGFRQNHSCETALIKIVDNWTDAIDKGYFIGTVFLDLRKAFDLVNHKKKKKS